VLSKALRDAVRHSMVVKNVAAEEGAPAVEADEMVILSPDQVRDLPARLKGQRLYARAITALHTGVRPQELLALRWNAVDLDTTSPRFAQPFGPTKDEWWREGAADEQRRSLSRR